MHPTRAETDAASLHLDDGAEGGGIVGAEVEPDVRQREELQITMHASGVGYAVGRASTHTQEGQ